MTQSRPLKIGDQVSLHYRLTCNDEEIVNTFAGNPETFRIGGSEIDPRLEMLLIGLQTGDHRSFELEPGAAFGSHDTEMVHELPLSDFAAGQALAAGNDVEFTLPNGQTLNGIIRSVGSDSAQVDFNHPLAGLPVVFEVKILGIEPD